MILLNIKIDNCYNFVNFDLNLSYPKRIVYSTIVDEFLKERPNFRYKKAVIVMGSNATGKTCLGRTIKNVCEFLNSGNYDFIKEMINDENEEASVIIEFVNDGYFLFETEVRKEEKDITVRIRRSEIREKDSYEMTKSRLEEIYFGPFSFEIREIIGKLDCHFAYPEIEKSLKTYKTSENDFLKTLKCIVGTLDPSLKNIVVAKDLKNSYIIKRGNQEIIIQDGKLLNRELLSSGTIEGIDVALFLSMMNGTGKNFYYCDEHFSYVQTDIEKRIFSIMVRRIKDGEQLFFTTHNADMLDLNVPKHTFLFLNRNSETGNTECSFASSILKRNTDSVRCAVENDMFMTCPDMRLLDELDEEDDK